MIGGAVLSNALLVLPDAVMPGTIVLNGATIARVEPGRSQANGAHDLGGDYLLPGAVDVHTDNLERQVKPRSNARWPSRSALVAHDAQCAAAGVTTVLDALCLGDLGYGEERRQTFLDGVVDLEALADTPLLKSEHFLHLRCELPATDMLELFDGVADHLRYRMVSLMDHTPGFGQYADIAFFRRLRRREGVPEAEIERRIAETQARRAHLREPNRRALLDRLAGRSVALASHDDRTAEEIAQNHADGIGISEFPVTMEAARAARAHGMQVVAGAPNIVRGGSHTGNVQAADLLRQDAVDALASDYVPSSLVEAAFLCARNGMALADSVALISDRPARMVRLDDRGRLEPGLRADFVRVRLHQGMPVIREVWRAGERVA